MGRVTRCGRPAATLAGGFAVAGVTFSRHRTRTMTPPPTPDHGYDQHGPSLFSPLEVVAALLYLPIVWIVLAVAALLVIAVRYEWNARLLGYVSAPPTRAAVRRDS